MHLKNIMKTKLFSVAKDDFEWHFFRGTGSGGQKKNKTSSCCRCVHRESGAIGESREERQQSQNRKIAFQRCVATPQFTNWLKAKSAAMSAGFASIEKQVDALMVEGNLKIEYYEPTR